ncbi:uncharacterized protein M6D78_017444 [Vipera latastei]
MAITGVGGSSSPEVLQLNFQAGDIMVPSPPPIASWDASLLQPPPHPSPAQGSLRSSVAPSGPSSPAHLAEPGCQGLPGRSWGCSHALCTCGTAPSGPWPSLSFPQLHLCSVAEPGAAEGLPRRRAPPGPRFRQPLFQGPWVPIGPPHLGSLPNTSLLRVSPDPLALPQPLPLKSPSSPSRCLGGHRPSARQFPASPRKAECPAEGPPRSRPARPSLAPPLVTLLISAGREGGGQGAKARLVLPGGGKRLGMGALAGAPLRPCQLLLLLGLFLLLLLVYLSGWHLPKLSLAACVRGGHRCPWPGETLPKEEEEEEEEPAPAPAPARTPTPPLPLQGKEFDIRHLQRAFSASLSPRGEILLQEYLQGWRELLKFLDALGRAFGLISRETESKISILQRHQEGPHGLHYRSLQSMVDFELASGLVGFQSLPAHQPPSGCRTLLRLHRALKWLELFLHKLGTSQKDEKSSRLCAEAYQVALAPYHSWWVQQAVALAFLAMPSRQELYHIIAQEKPATGAIVLTTVKSLGRVYNVTQEVYSAHGMLELP